MKLFLFLLTTLLLGIWICSCHPAEGKKGIPGTPSPITHPTALPVEGAWKLVWAQYNDTLADMTNHILVKMFTGGSFSLFAHDSTGTIKFTGYGKYNFEGDTYHEKFLYHNNPRFVGGEDWQNLSVQGDTMYLNGFTKVVIGGKEMTSGWTKVREKLVKVNW